MKYHLNFLEDKGIVLGKIEDTITLELAIAYLSEASELALANEAKRILTDTRASSVDINEEGTEILSRSLEELGITPDLKRAVLIRNDVNFFKLWENLNLKEGRSKLRLFIEEDMAYDWLKLES